MAITIPCAASEPITDPPTKITYILGGHMSGPFRLIVNLVTGEVEVADPPAGVRGDPVGISLGWDLPVSRRLTASDADLRELRTLAVTVWAYGIEEGVNTVDGEPVICTAASDALRRLVIERGRQSRTFDSSGCENAAGRRFFDKLLCLPHPDDAYCKLHR